MQFSGSLYIQDNSLLSNMWLQIFYSVLYMSFDPHDRIFDRAKVFVFDQVQFMNFSPVVLSVASLKNSLPSPGHQILSSMFFPKSFSFMSYILFCMYVLYFTIKRKLKKKHICSPHPSWNQENEWPKQTQLPCPFHLIKGKTHAWIKGYL